MPKNDKYHPDYEKLYPGIKIRSEILRALKQSDRKMEYIERDLKTERFRYHSETGSCDILRSREDSLDRLQEEEKHQFSQTFDLPEEVVFRKMEYAMLLEALGHLTKEEQRLVYLRYWLDMTQREIAEKYGTSQQMVSYRERHLLRKLKILLKNLL
ncbi:MULTISPECIES: sigma-70 family RNA polymerase sigma factor [Anaerotruncus]|uniref:sigma-70 family RNA polymerase sigma factor n=1 Tax=Anaerotruncus TaxID=244127 RepID=UPI0013149898|nr:MULTISPECIES: sigma-70 family RNA polymerase sigma factor [Anaerotruncus]